MQRQLLPTFRRAFSSKVTLSSDKDYYAVLGVARDSQHETIKNAYFKLAKRHHPDLNTGKSESEIETSKKVFQEVSEAYQVLADETLKIKYDGMNEESAMPASADDGMEEKVDQNFYHKVFAA